MQVAKRAAGLPGRLQLWALALVESGPGVRRGKTWGAEEGGKSWWEGHNRKEEEHNREEGRHNRKEEEHNRKEEGHNKSRGQL